MTLGDIHKEVDPAEIRHAAEQSSASQHIETLPDGYKTPLMRIFEPNGLKLSIGQWQKLAVARAFYADSDILILDEPTASLDAIFDRLRAPFLFPTGFPARQSLTYEMDTGIITKVK